MENLKMGTFAEELDNEACDLIELRDQWSKAKDSLVRSRRPNPHASALHLTERTLWRALRKNW